MASTLQDPSTLLHEILETQYQQHINHLARLTVSGRRRNHNGADQSHHAKIAATRQAVSDTARALRRMAEGTYGTCERCRGRIPVQQLRTVPHARFCEPCRRPGTEES